MASTLAERGEIAGMPQGLGRGKRTQLPARYQDDIRKKIQVVHLINRVQDYALGNIEMTMGQVHASFKLIDKCLANAVPVEVSDNLRANTALAIQSIQQAQLMAMAQEMLNQGLTIDASPIQLVDTNVSTHSPVEIPSVESEQLLTVENSTRGVGKGGVGVSEGDSNQLVADENSQTYHEDNQTVAQQESNPYPDLPDHLG